MTHGQRGTHVAESERASRARDRTDAGHQTANQTASLRQQSRGPAVRQRDPPTIARGFQEPTGARRCRPTSCQATDPGGDRHGVETDGRPAAGDGHHHRWLPVALLDR